ncbi:hypothetical protein F2P56_012828 [Juglans regia]|uniref:(+)-cis,trans-nepetalactol synthase NEPS1-like n=2 Tax=Juglans regia TaxID=51240 RepID=A0A2I4E9R3_JUGRE|nr:(+)-cis,trans-nepetalactol synthase NEPS1-like [Juglans regia]KAF5468691.1 hypothetical protein F2P56_012828 [Juglans regia]
MAEPTLCKKKLEGKVAIVTGGASGIGEATAYHFAKHGARMVVIADIQEELGQQVAKSIGFSYSTFLRCDVANEEQVKDMVEWTVKKYGQLDIIFSNVGTYSRRSDQTVLDLDLLALDHVFATNVRGMAAWVKQSARAMVEGGVRGPIVCTASVAASRGAVNRTDYYMSKHAVLGHVSSASKQLGKYGIRVNSISPSTVATPMVCSAIEMDAEQLEKAFEPHASLKGITLKVEHIADAVLFLASDDSGFVNGHDLVVDGGWLD